MPTTHIGPALTALVDLNEIYSDVHYVEPIDELGVFVSERTLEVTCNWTIEDATLLKMATKTVAVTDALPPNTEDIDIEYGDPTANGTRQLTMTVAHPYPGIEPPSDDGGDDGGGSSSAATGSGASGGSAS